TGFRESPERFATAARTAPPAALDRGVARAVERLSALTSGGAEADLALRRRLAAARRPMLEGMPYGASWIALSEALFPEGHPQAGAVLAGPLSPGAELLFSEHVPRSSARITITVRGAVERAALDGAVARALGSFGIGAGAPFGPHPHEDRRAVAAGVVSPRLLVGWIAPPRGDAAEGATRLAVAVLVHGKIGRAQRALVLDRRVAARVRGVLELGRRGSVAAIEVVPAVPHDAAEADAALSAVIDELGRAGPSPEELGAARALLTAGLEKERLRAASAVARQAAVGAEVDGTLAAVATASVDDVRAAARDVLSRDHRVVVITEPRR
ncbi:MAG: lytic murein transglycosylase, partial [Polyangiaceae bacterium]|nr:lytic murein transglycosylase [Polyangiaceae bacterium]